MTSTAAPPTSETLVGRARALVPALSERALEAEALRRIPDASVADIRAAQLTRTLRPAHYGGFEQDYRTFGHVVSEIARGCASTGWCSASWLSQAWSLTRYPVEAQDEVCLADPDAFIGSTAVPSANIERVAGGWRVNGRWSFASGVHGAGWMMCGALTASKELRYCLIPTSDLELLDTWNAVGLRATGSTDTVAHNVFIPDHRCIDSTTYVIKPASAPFVLGPMRNHSLSLMVNVSIFSSAAIGNARAFIEAFASGAADRVITYAQVRQAEFPGTQHRFGESALEVDLAAMLLERCYDDLDTYEHDGRIPRTTRARMRRDSSFAVNLAYRAIDRLFQVSGAHALSSEGELQRRWRDAHAIASQPNFNFDLEAETWAKLQFGLEINHPTLYRD